ncbi:anthocyanidin 5 3-o-glucosyltransferase [Phtheirospermum japonicum]|uniref:Anthocyanidin 5 3-o-glucosyltransferase n=1 Tax=Phtheirospermum japonicum TaxID=374723 RepID=A0A830B2Q5_9LAMI|nr:anthocyanidin 5 3-o-glucosyltransferase [Phtheirospermum japonicum]
MGHLVSMVELGKFILRHHPSAAITILTVPPSFNTGSTASYIRRVSATVPSITFHDLPTVPLDLHAFPSMEAVIFETLGRSCPHVRRALETITATSGGVSAFIIDFFCTSSHPIAAELNIPTYYFVTSGAAVFAFLLYFPIIHNTTTESFKDMKNTLLDVPGLPLFPASDMMVPLLDRQSLDYKNFLEFSLNIPNSAGIMINTFESLETKCLQTIREGKCNPNGRTPPVFTVGPLLAAGDGEAAHDCLKWLDKQPSKSVVYLCFGSLGLLSEAQLKEIALGLEKSGRRFLWVVRSPPTADETEPDLDLLLPAGFLDRTDGRASW